MKARLFPKLDIPDDYYNLELFIDHYDTLEEQIEFLKYAKFELDLYYEPRFEEDVDIGDVKEYEELGKVLDKRIKFYEGMLYNGIENNSQIKKSNVKNINISESEKVFKECLEKGTEYFLAQKHTRIHFIHFYIEMKKDFGDDIKLLEKAYYNIVNDNPVIKIFGFNYDLFKKKMGAIRDKKELLSEFEEENKEIENLLEAVSQYRPDYYIKWERVNNQNIYEEELEEKGFVDKKDSDAVKYKNAWIKYFIEDVRNKKLREMLIYGFSGNMDEREDIDNNNSVKLFLEQIESEVNSYQQKVLQTYLIAEKKLGLDEGEKSKKKKQKKQWKKNKSEFARFINEEYERNNEDYKSLRDASNKLFDEYEFEDKNWTKEKCYDLVRQT